MAAAKGVNRDSLWTWAPAVVLVVGAIVTLGIDTQTPMPLRAELGGVVPHELQGFTGRDVVITDEELRVAGVSSYLLREFVEPGPTPDEAGPAAFSVYVGYYESQTQGRTIHSPKNCLPGAGWEALQSSQVALATPAGVVPANRYLLQRGDQRALVVYWYQGRGRVEANEYLVKAQLLRDAMFHGRTEEALVRIVVPFASDEDAAFEVAASVASRLVPSVYDALPAA